MTNRIAKWRERRIFDMIRKIETVFAKEQAASNVTMMPRSKAQAIVDEVNRQVGGDEKSVSYLVAQRAYALGYARGKMESNQ